eukprot:754582-Hanusia_phi.AAC.10
MGLRDNLRMASLLWKEFWGYGQKLLSFRRIPIYALEERLALTPNALHQNVPCHQKYNVPGHEMGCVFCWTIFTCNIWRCARRRVGQRGQRRSRGEKRGGEDIEEEQHVRRGGRAGDGETRKECEEIKSSTPKTKGHGKKAVEANKHADA